MFIKHLLMCVITFDLSQNSLFVDAPVQPVTEAVLQLLKVSLGQSPSPAPYNKSFVHLIGCSRVQRCGLDALISLSSCEGRSHDHTSLSNCRCYSMHALTELKQPFWRFLLKKKKKGVQKHQQRPRWQ